MSQNDHTTLSPMPDPRDLAPTSDLLATIGAQANHHAEQNVFADYLTRRADNTIRRQAGDVRRFADFLQLLGDRAQADLSSTMRQFADHVESYLTDDPVSPDPTAWQGVTWGLIEAFRNWMISQGYAVGTVNVRLATIKRYARLAAKAGVIDTDNYAKMKLVTGYNHKEAKRVNAHRDTARRGHKKADPVHITDQQADRLKNQPDTPQGRRDALLMALLLDMGLRCGEIAALTVGAFDLDARKLTFYRPKVDMTQTHDMPSSVYQAARVWFDHGHASPMKDDPVLRGTRKGGHLTEPGMSERAISARVRALGVDVGLYEERPHETDGGKTKTVKHGTLSPHDCRHYWATYWANRVEKLPRGVFTLQEAGGWASLAMPRRYVEAAQIANQGMA